MTHDEALQEARRRWGDKGYIRDLASKVCRFKVGKQSGGIFWVEGAADSWEAAFQAADQRDNGPE